MGIDHPRASRIPILFSVLLSISKILCKKYNLQHKIIFLHVGLQGFGEDA
jgi:hypothetical protein